MTRPPPESIRRLVYLGTPDTAVGPLRALVGATYEVGLVVTRPDRRRGRRGGATPSPVKRAAIELGLPVTSDLDDIDPSRFDLGVVVAYGQLIPTPLLDRLAMVNIHFSLLPRWRGAAPVERALLAGDNVTGVCLMAVEPELDTGDVYRRAELPIGPSDTASDLRRRLTEIGTAQLLAALAEGLGRPVPQSGPATYAEKLSPDDVRLDWERPAVVLDRRVRVGGAWTTFRGRRLKVHRANPVEAGPGPGRIELSESGSVIVGAGGGSLELLEVQPEGKAPMAAPDWARGARPGPDDVLGE